MNNTNTEKERLLHVAFEGLSNEYPPGLYDWLYAHDRGTYDEINQLEDEVNENFLKGGSVDDLKAILREYWRLHMVAIRSFKGRGQSDTSLSETRVERIQELESSHV